jgi:cytosine/adenosine deaminase-related metal-dependent hydrolase
MMAANTDNICIGTDSLASNTRLSVMAELQVLNNSFPEIGWERLLRWATSGGAKALQMNEAVGTFAARTKPAVLNLSLESGTIQRII